MNTVVRTLLGMLLLVLAQESLALACHKDKPGFVGARGEIDGDITISETIAVPAQLAKDSVLWRSPQQEATITCWADRTPTDREQVHFWLSPLDPGLTGLGGELEVGVNVNGTDYRCSSSKLQHGCGVALEDFWIEACPRSAPLGHCEKEARTFRISYNFFISKLSPASSVAKEGSIAGVESYVIFQLDGKGGINNTVQRNNFRMTLRGLNQLRYVACASTLGIQPDTVRFGSISSLQAGRNKVIKELPFSITAKKDCDNAYALGAVMTPTNGTVQDNHVLVPKDNQSVGITLLSAEDGAVVPFNKEFSLVPHSRDKVVERKFNAQLKWLTDKPVLGPFNTGAEINVYYK